MKWACCNVGATKPEDFGNYFAWGETEERDNEYVKENYVYANEDIGSCISGTEYDVATKKWGSAYMMPTKADAEELIENCTLEPTVLNGVVGFRFIAANGNSIFMPIAGFHWLYGRDSYVGVYGNYWTGDKYEDDIDGYRLYLECQEASAILNASFRYNGQNVRPVSYHTTGIVAIDDSNKTYGHYYTLDGLQVEKANYSGLYIRNGKKVLIR